MENNPYKIVKATWRDASNSGIWETLEDVMEGAKVSIVETVGYLIDSNEEYLVLATGMSDPMMLLSVQTIPAENVLSITELKEA